MIKTLLTILILLLSFLTQAQTTFEKVYSDSGITNAYDIITTYDGGYAVTGFKTCGTFNCLDFFLLKLDALGNQEWVRIYDGFGFDDLSYSIIQSSDSGYVMSGFSSTPPNLAQNIWLLKVDKNGNKLWDRNYGGLGCQEGYDIEQTFDGGFIIATQQDTGGNCFEIQVELIKTDTAGIIEWQKTYFNVGNGRAVAVKQTNDSGFVVTGLTNNMLSPTSSEDIFLLKTDKNGDTLWTKFYGNIGAERGEDVIITSTGNFVIAGYTSGFFNSNQIATYIIKTNNMGDTLWTKVIEKGDQNVAYHIIEDNNTNYVIAGYTSITLPPGNSDVYLLKTDSNGTKIFEKQFQYQANADEGAHSVALTNDGGYIMCGLTQTPTAMVYVVKTDSNGLITGINDVQKPLAVNLKVYPNPFNNYTTVDLSEIYQYNSKNISIELYDFTGKLLFQQKVTEAKTILYNQGYAKGMYLLTIKNNQQLIATKKIIIN
jgi:hypothetical protein